MRDAIKVPFADHQFDALGSICFNIGQGGCKGSTFLKRINTRASASDIRAAILAWHNPAEILPRRLAEADHFEMPYTTRLPKARGIDAAPIGILGIWKYLKKLKSPTTVTGDRIIPGLAIADMQPIRDLAAAQARTAAAGERTAAALEKMLALSQERAEDTEIVRRAEILAQEMLKKLPATTARNVSAAEIRQLGAAPGA